jgi:GNAT superfamily N-acetyltransferase
MATRFLKDLDTKENVTTEAHLLNAAVALPPEFAAQLVPSVVRCLRNGNHMLNPVRLSELLQHLATPLTEKALKRLAAEIFNPPGAIDDYWYKSELPSAALTLHAVLGIDAIGILVGWIFDASKIDGAGFWRSSIADHPQNSDFGIGSALVDAARDLALAHVRSDHAALPAVVARLRTPATRTEVSDRIALHVLATAVREDVVGARSLAEEVLLDSAFLEYPFVLEYGELGAAVLLGAASEVVDRWMDLVEHDPYPSDEDVRGILSYFDNRDPADVRDDEITLYRDRKIRDRMVLVESSLPERLLSRLRELDEDVGARDPHTGFAVWSESFVGPVSPTSSEDLTDKSPDEVIEYLLSWVPPVGEMFGPSREGLGRQLAIMVEASPLSMTSVAQRIPELHSTYVRSILDGWTNAVKNGVLEIDWDAVLPVIDFAARQPDEGDVRGTGDEDTGWRASHKSAISLLRGGMLAPEALRIPIAHRDTVWLNIERISESPDPTPSRESNDGMDIMSLALNAVRCDAIDATVVYLSWLQAAGLPVNSIGADAGAPEAWAILDRHLDQAVDPSSAVRVIYGQAFPYLAHVSPEWAEANAARVLGVGEDEVETRLRDVGWAAFVTRRDPSKAMLELLGSIYLERLRLPSQTVPQPMGGQSFGDRISFHVLTLYAWGLVDIDSVDQLVRAFFEHAAVEVRSKALGHLGWWLNQLRDGTPPKMVERLQRLWEWRRKVIDAGASAAEFAEAGWWLRCRQFPDGWIVEQIAHAVATGTMLEHPRLVAEDLEYLARGFPGECIAVLEAILAVSTGWEQDLVGRHAAPAIAAGLDSDDDTIRHRANDLLSNLGESGVLTLYDEVQALREHP